jgi:hypothetical protein
MDDTAHGAEFLTAFKIAFGRPAPASVQTSDGRQIVYSPQAMINLGNNLVALVSAGGETEVAHASEGVLAIHYLRRTGDSFSLLGAWPAIGGVGPESQAASWKVRTDLDTDPVMVTYAEDGGQGCYAGRSDIIALTPAGPIVRASDVILYTEYKPDEGDSSPAYKFRGQIVPEKVGQSFRVDLHGTRTIVQKYTRSGDKFYLTGEPPPTC